MPFLGREGGARGEKSPECPPDQVSVTQLKVRRPVRARGWLTGERGQVEADLLVKQRKLAAILK